jgi:hypothetical protein
VCSRDCAREGSSESGPRLAADRDRGSGGPSHNRCQEAFTNGTCLVIFTAINERRASDTPRNVDLNVDEPGGGELHLDATRCDVEVPELSEQVRERAGITFGCDA